MKYKYHNFFSLNLFLAFSLITISSALACDEKSICALGPLGYCKNYHLFLKESKALLEKEGDEGASQILKAYGKSYDSESLLNLQEQAQLYLDRGGIVIVDNYSVELDNENRPTIHTGAGGVGYNPLTGSLEYRTETGITFNPETLSLEYTSNIDRTFDPRIGKVVSGKSQYGIQYNPKTGTLESHYSTGLAFDPNQLNMPPRFNLELQKKELDARYRAEEKAALEELRKERPFLLNLSEMTKYRKTKKEIKNRLREKYAQLLQVVEDKIQSIQKRHYEVLRFDLQTQNTILKFQKEWNELIAQRDDDITQELSKLGKAPGGFHFRKSRRYQENANEIISKITESYATQIKAIRKSYDFIFPQF